MSKPFSLAFCFCFCFCTRHRKTVGASAHNARPDGFCHKRQHLRREHSFAQKHRRQGPQTAATQAHHSCGHHSPTRTSPHTPPSPPPHTPHIHPHTPIPHIPTPHAPTHAPTHNPYTPHPHNLTPTPTPHTTHTPPPPQSHPHTSPPRDVWYYVCVVTCGYYMCVVTCRKRQSTNELRLRKVSCTERPTSWTLLAVTFIVLFYFSINFGNITSE